MGKRIDHTPACPSCHQRAELVSGYDIWPDRQDLWEKPIYRCGPCDTRVGCHPGTKRPLGPMADAELRRARMLLHEQRLDPIWKGAIVAGGYEPEDPKARAIITRTARSRVYKWLGAQMGIEFHTATLTLDQCRQAWRLLSGTDYQTIRAWAKARKTEETNDAPAG